MNEVKGAVTVNQDPAFCLELLEEGVRLLKRDNFFFVHAFY
jgi:hypothetical protein